MGTRTALALLGIGLALAACGDDKKAPPPTVLTNASGWPMPQASWSAIYRVTVELASDDLFRERGDAIKARAALSLVQREGALWTDAGLQMDILRGLIGGSLEREHGGKVRKSSLGDIIGVGREEGTAPGLRLWLSAPGTAQRLAWSDHEGVADGLVFGLVPTPAEAPTEGLSWEHDTAFLPSLASREGRLRATSTLTTKGGETWTLTSRIEAPPPPDESTGDPQPRVEGERTLELSALDGTVLRGTFSGNLFIDDRRGSATVRVKGRIELVSPTEAPRAAAEIETALEAMAHADATVRRDAAVSIGETFPQGGRGAHVLAAAARHDEDGEVRAAALAGISSLAQQSAVQVAAFLKDPAAVGRDDFLTTMRAVIGTRASTVDLAGAVRAAPKGGALAMALTPYPERVPGVRFHGDVTEVLSNQARPLVTAGVPLRDPEGVEFSAMANALFAMSHLPTSSRRAAPEELLALFEHANPVVQWAAVRVTHLLGARTRDTLNALRKLRDKTKGAVRAAAAAALAETPDPKVVAARVAELIEKLPAADSGQTLSTEQVAILEELGQIGKPAKDALPVIERVMKANHKKGHRPTVRTLIAAEAMCRIGPITGKNLGLFTITLLPPPKLSTNKKEQAREMQVFVARAQRASRALAHLIDRLPNRKVRRQIAKRAADALPAYPDTIVVQALTHILRTVGPAGDPAAKRLATMLQQAQKNWIQTLAIETNVRGNPELAHRPTLLLEFGNDFSSELELRHGLVLVFRNLGTSAQQKTLPVLDWLRDTKDALLRYEVATTLRRIEK